VTIRVLLVDDSAIIRGLINKAISTDSKISIVGSAMDGVTAIQNAKNLQPDVIILDIEMPNMDGITALPELLKVSPKSKIIMASTLTERNATISMQALSLGAADYLPKPTARETDNLQIFYRELINKIHALAPKTTPAAAPVAATVTHAPTAAILHNPYPKLQPGAPLNPMGITALAIASSTGGPQALTSLFTQLKGQLKNIPIFITQHMPPTFTTILADQLTKVGERPCHEAKEGDIALPGHTYLAPGDFHMVTEKKEGVGCVVHLNQNAPENYCRPAADPMLRSLSTVYGARLAVVVLTGMGQDGMEGAKVVNQNGGSVIAQDEASCVVYGMPKAVVDHNLCKSVMPLSEMGQFLIRQIDGKFV
jgi:two-component system, chemotaxis family, protein-glutamate methylesterase/glutaminase